MAIPTGVIFIWTGTNASIPAGWQRVTDLDDRFVKDDYSAINSVGGNTTHTHSSSAHTHSMSSHTHTVSYSGTVGGTNQDSGASSGGGIQNFHSHPAQTSGVPTNTSVSSEAATYTAVSNNPPYYEVIFISPTTTAGGLPNLAIGLTDDTGFVNNTGKYGGYYNCDGLNSTPNLTSKYLKGASAGANAGGTGGSTTNSHTLSHTHSTSHDHASLTTPASTDTRNTSTGGSNMASNTHTHTVTINSAVVSTNDTPSTTTPETVEPAYKTLLALQNRSSSAYTPVGIIGMWLGTLASLPSNFELVTSMDTKYLKIGSVVGDIGVTGGSNTHTHASSTHTHSVVSHTHSADVSVFGTNIRHSGNSRGGVANHRHDGYVSSENITLDVGSTSANSSSNEPEYRTVAFIKYKGEKGGAFLFNFVR
jgi:hypothetical protein